MPLVEGEWKLFIDKKEVPLKIMDLDNKGHIQCTMENWVVYGGAAPLLGDGFWNELGKQITFKAEKVIPPGDSNIIVFSFNGYLIEGTSTEPAVDKLWTLVGTYQILMTKTFIPSIPTNLGLLTQDSRRQKLGWYAQITEVI